jgi:hypothetical protein
MSSYPALLDDNVLYPAPVRDLLLQIAVTDIYSSPQLLSAATMSL